MRISIVFAFIIAVVLFACGGEKSTDGTKRASIENGTPQTQVDPLAAGKKAFKMCIACHGADGKLGINGARDFAESDLKLEERIEVITNGRGMMMAFKGVLKPEQIKAAAEYTIHLGKQTEE
jgi:mono/diheme cytochrome c family protein